MCNKGLRTGSKTRMPVPTLPGTHWAAPRGLFDFVYHGGEFVAYSLVTITFLGAFSYCFPRMSKHTTQGDNHMYSIYYTSSMTTKCSTSLRNCGTFLSWVFIYLYRILNVKLFPGLFKEHKDRHKDQSSNRTVTRVFILFLDRRVENNSVILLAFCFLALAICSSALLVVFHYVPVAISTECLEKDDQERDLFCYTNESPWPVDCAKYNSTDHNMPVIDFVCYTLTLSIFDLGIAIAAAAALAKLATVSITIYIRVSESVYKWSKGNTRRYCRLNAKCIYTIYCVLAVIALCCYVILFYSTVILTSQSRTGLVEGRLSFRFYFTYSFLPFMLVPSLTFVMCTLGKHCDQEEYISCCQDQLPLFVNDRHEYMEAANCCGRKPVCNIDGNMHNETRPMLPDVNNHGESHSEDVELNGAEETRPTAAVTINLAYGATEVTAGSTQ